MRIMLMVAALPWLLQDAPPKEDRIATLCDELGSGDPAYREQATRELIRIGRPALGPVTRLLDSDDAELKIRAREVLQSIRRNLARKALRLEVAADRKTYRPGEKVTLSARLVNAEDFAVTALKFIYDGGLHPESWIRVRLGGEALRYAGDPLPQVMLHHRMTEDRFLSLPAGGGIPVRQVDFSQAWDLGGKDPSLKESYRTGTLAPLKPGRYAVQASYSFRFDLDRLERIDREKNPDYPQLDWSFEGRSKELLAEAWQGSLEAETEFVVDP